MNSRLFVLAVAVLAVVAFVLFVVLVGRSALPAAEHGDFSSRFQPSAPSVSTDRERLAGVGSIKDLRPVDTKAR